METRIGQMAVPVTAPRIYRKQVRRKPKPQAALSHSERMDHQAASIQNGGGTQASRGFVDESGERLELWK
jgi:hypothetical protein